VSDRRERLGVAQRDLAGGAMRRLGGAVGRGGWAAGIVLVAVVTSITMILVSALRSEPLSTLETVLFQAIALGLGIAGSYYWGQTKKGGDVPQAKSAFRRVASLYRALYRFDESIEERRLVLAGIARLNGDAVPLAHIESTLSLLSTQVREQIQTASDAVADWRDLAPQTVEELVRERRAGDDANA
jgi:hypothetical protein